MLPRRLLGWGHILFLLTQHFFHFNFLFQYFKVLLRSGLFSFMSRLVGHNRHALSVQGWLKCGIFEMLVYAMLLVPSSVLKNKVTIFGRLSWSNLRDDMGVCCTVRLCPWLGLLTFLDFVCKHQSFFDSHFLDYLVKLPEVVLSKGCKIRVHSIDEL